MLEHLLMLIAFLDVVSTCSTNFHFLTARFRASGRGRAAGRGPGGNHDRRPQGTSNESRGNSAREPRHDYVRGNPPNQRAESVGTLVVAHAVASTQVSAQQRRCNATQRISLRLPYTSLLLVAGCLPE